MDTASLMDTIIHLFASSLLLMFDCDYTFLFILYFYILYNFPLFPSARICWEIPVAKWKLYYRILFKKYYYDKSPWNFSFIIF